MAVAPRMIGGPQLARLLGELPAERPFYAVLARAIRGLILDGGLALRVRLPAERDLAAALGVSRTTVTAAYDALRAESFIRSRRGAGSWTALPRGRTSRLPHATATATIYGMAEPEIDLGSAAPGAPELFDEAVADAVARLPAHTAGPGYDPAGLGPLREAVAARYTARGLPTRPEQIMITAGAQHALNLLAEELMTPGDPVLVESPTYPHALDALRRRGARLIPVGVNAGWDVELIATSMRQTAVRFAYVNPDFHNPTGRLMDDAGRAALVEAARRAGCHLVVDETFAELPLDDDLHGGQAMPPPLAAHDTDGRVISVGSAAKVFWGGLRIGWIRTTPPMARRLATLRESLDLASPVLEQLIVRELLLRVDEVRAERVALLRAGRQALVAALGDLLPHWEFTVPRGGMSLWARLPAPASTSLAGAAARLGVRVVPGPLFGVDGLLEDYVRLPYVQPPGVLGDAIERLARAYQSVETSAAPRYLPSYV
ncbi:MAG TPA: PLP-dependent aminotransferase family protein [Streptosporangiaceae bacterium]|nr:PLP-dependent aminotransferase family protein [Streptosporangiaceae bacterium]